MDDFGYDMEAIEVERFEVDMQMAEWAREAALFEAARRAGKCTHSSVVGYRNPPIYPEQEGLTPGQQRCTDGCGAVFASEADWHRAITEAVHGS